MSTAGTATRTVTLHDMCLRDGMHAKRHQISIEEMLSIAGAMDAAGIPLIEVTHGDGLGGASVNYGFPAHSDEEYLSAVCASLKNARVSALLLPGIGTVEHLNMAVDCGIGTIRVAAHCTEADVTEQHLTAAAKIDGLDVVGFLMMAHMTEPEALTEQLKLLESFGANCVYITDSAGYMMPEDVTARVTMAREALHSSTEIGFHGHNNLGLAVANSIAAVEAGATRIDGSLASLGAGAGNTQLEVFAAVCDRKGWETGVDVALAADAADQLVVPMMDHPVRIDSDSLTLGYAGVYSSFLLFAKRASEKYGVPSRDILVELGRRRTVGGQEDMIEDVAIELSRRAKDAA